MSGQPAARVGDNIACPVLQVIPPPGVPPPHAPPPGLPIIPPGAPTVLIGGKLAARMGDQSMCLSPAPLPNPILRGSFPVTFANMPAARATDSGTHPGSTISPPCCTSVEIGLAGTTGDPWTASKVCQSMAAGRNPAPGSTDGAGNPLPANSAGQNYNNCGVETSRQVINHATGSNLTQEGLLNSAMANGNAAQATVGSVQGGTVVTAQNQMFFSGGTVPSQQAAILTNNGVPASVIPATPTGAQLGQYELALSQGKGVLAGGDVAGLPGWGGQSGGHAVLITGYEYDDNGNIVAVHYNDTGIGVCNQTATPAQFQNAMNIEANNLIAQGFTPLGAAVTNNPIW